MDQNRCPYCSGALRTTKLTCQDCGLGLEGDFVTPRLSRLEPEEQRFAELFVLASGSLKQMAEVLMDTEAARFVEKDAGSMPLSVLATVSSKIESFAYLGDAEPAKRFSVKDFADAQDDGRGRWLFFSI